MSAGRALSFPFAEPDLSRFELSWVAGIRTHGDI
jgi:hypothetical protein